ncbi:Contains similarity to IAA13 auxin inducible protein gi/1363484 from Arabidopsis thaliana [Arabidopsis thaliana]|nr:Contains similarity to IAA13 auxin inducible protein gi/1363484 from Arabidopsis thaliana [Arabidopsis thaliana]
MYCSDPPHPLHLVASDKQQKDHKLILSWKKPTMDSDPLGVFPNSPKYHPYYSQTTEFGGVIDLGLSLRTIQHEIYHSSGQSRKVCVLDHGSYSTLAHQLEDMFGMQSVSGLRLFQMESEFCLVYRDEEGLWRNAGDVPWNEFIESVERLRITRRNDAVLPF